MVPEFTSAVLEMEKAAVFELGFVGFDADIDIGSAVAEHSEAENGELSGHGEDGDAGAVAEGEPAVVGAEGGEGMLQGEGGHAEGVGQVGGACGGLFAAEGFVTGGGGMGGEAQPGDEVVFVGKGAQVGTDLGGEGERGTDADAVDDGEVFAEEPPEILAQGLFAPAAQGGLLFGFGVGRGRLVAALGRLRHTEQGMPAGRRRCR